MGFPDCSALPLQKEGKKRKSHAKKCVLGWSQGQPADRERRDIFWFSLCRHQSYPKPKGKIQTVCKSKIQSTEGAAARTRGPVWRMSESLHLHRPAHITTLISCCKQIFNNLQYPLTWTIFPAANHVHLSYTWPPPSWQMFPPLSEKTGQRHRITCNAAQGTLTLVGYQGKSYKDGELSNRPQKKSTHRPGGGMERALGD